MSMPDTLGLEVSKAIEQIAFIARSYALSLWTSDANKADWKHDLTVMHRHGDLEHVRLELLAADQTVLFEFKIRFTGSGGGERLADTGQGVELPVLDRRRVAGHRLIVQQLGHVAGYRHLLRMPWQSAATLPKRAGDAFESEHARKITGGRQHGLFHVPAEARHRLLITRVGDRGFAFARDLDLGVEGVFLHAKFALQGFEFRPGRHVTAVVVQTPRGLQARNIVSL
jgi:hypothetical protein